MKYPLIFVATLLISVPLFAQNEKVETHDLNKDGISDRFEYSVNAKIIRIEEDQNGDKKIDFKTILNDKVFYKIELQDADQDGKFERKKSHLLLPEKKTRVITEMDNNGDGVFEVRYETVLDNLQKQDCGPAVSATIKEFSGTVLKAVSKTDKGLLPTGLGYKVDYECYNKWGDDFNKIVKEVAVGGLQCLMNLDKKGRVGANMTGAIRNAFNLTKLMKNDGISLVCSEETYNWTSTMAHASTTPGDKMESKNITHPYVSINPNHPENSSTNRDQEIAELKDTIFHETLHTLGFRHGEDVEFSYTCGLCCFDKDAGEKVKAQACKICTGNYKNETNVKYVKDFIEYSQLNYQPQRGAVAAQKYLKENAKNTPGLAMLAYAESGVFNPVGGELAKMITLKNKVLSATDKKYLTDAGQYNEMVEFKSVKVTSKALAGSLYELYYNKSGVKAINELEKNKVAIKAELAKMKKGKDNNPYIHDEIRNVLDKIINEMFVYNYPDKTTSDKAFELYEYFQEPKK